MSARRCSRGVGLIPAHAGKTRRRTRTLAPCGAHPRSRGENIECRPECDADDGSSPLTRGKRSRAWSPTPTPGLIPTHAGKTRRICGMGTRNWAHPHSRGENDSLPGCTSGWEGSSPLTRGKPRPGRVPGPPPRLIPTHAGKTSWPSSAPPESPAHPHSRGENPLMTLTLTAAGGLIPTHAGKTMVRRAHER